MVPYRIVPIIWIQKKKEKKGAKADDTIIFDTILCELWRIKFGSDQSITSNKVMIDFIYATVISCYCMWIYLACTYDYVHNFHFESWEMSLRKILWKKLGHLKKFTKTIVINYRRMLYITVSPIIWKIISDDYLDGTDTVSYQ